MRDNNYVIALEKAYESSFWHSYRPLWEPNAIEERTNSLPAWAQNPGESLRVLYNRMLQEKERDQNE